MTSCLTSQLAELYEKHKFKNFPELHEAWKKTLDTSELNKRFFKEIAYWYFWAVNEVTFPDGAEKDKEIRNATSVIRLITRLIFVWFIKEKGLVPNDLFKHEKIKEILAAPTTRRAPTTRQFFRTYSLPR